VIHDPAAMTPKERTAEVAAILARGWIRTLTSTSGGNGIGQSGPSTTEADGESNSPRGLSENEPSCEHAVDTARRTKIA
jgi:hypothetical protein